MNKNLRIVKSKNKKLMTNNGITLIALVITIIVLLILAGVSIATLSGKNGILNKAGEAKEETVLEEEKEEIKVAHSSALTNNLGEFVTSEDLQKELDSLIGAGKTKVEKNVDDSLSIEFLDTKNKYKIENGVITKEEIYKTTDENPTEFSGNGTEDNPYLIESIEDLVLLATNVNSGTTYDGMYFELTQSLNFNSDLSYYDATAKYIYDETKKGYVLNEDGTAIKTLCTTGDGFIPIGCENRFGGFVDGKGNSIDNIYINNKTLKYSMVALFGNLYNTEYNQIISNLNTSVKIEAENASYVGGLIGYIEGQKVMNCASSVNIVAENDANRFNHWWTYRLGIWRN